MECAPGGRQHRGYQIFHRRSRIAAIGERCASASEQQTAAAPVHKIADQLLLRRRKVVRLNAADDEALEAEKLFGLDGKAIRQFLFVLGALYVEFILRGSQNASDFDIRKIVQG